MKFMSLLSLLISISTLANSSHCNVLENGQVSKCEEYPSNKNKKKAQNLCLLNNITAGPVIIRGEYGIGKCKSKEALAKCKLSKSGIISYYYKAINLSLEEMESNCKGSRNAIFTRLKT